VAELARAFVDVHHHAGPDVYRRAMTSRQAGRCYAELGGWVVVKSHLGSTAAQAWEARQDGLPVSGTLVLNRLAGGVHPRVLEQSVYQHGPDSPARLVVHLPTLTSPAHPSALPRQSFHPLLDIDRWRGAGVTEDDGRLRPEVVEVIRAARDLPVVLATGHCTRDQTLRIVEQAAQLGLTRLLLTHATHPMSGLTVADLADLAGIEAVYVELTALTRLLGHHDETQFRAVVDAHPRVVFSSDLGQPDQPDVLAWLDISRTWFAEAGIGDDRVRELVLTNPARLLAP
jgi:hypothetical protein